MKDILIKSAIIVESGNEWDGKKTDVLIKEGLIAQIGDNIKAKNIEVFEASNLHLSQGWMDMQVSYCDPGLEHKEDINSGIMASVQGGFTAALVMPATEPAISSKSGVEYMIKAAKDHPVFDLVPAGAVSADLKGNDIAELYDMWRSGAKAFTDYKSTCVNTRLLGTALIYAKNFGGLIISFPLDDDLFEGRMVHEGPIATQLGFLGIPEIAEGIAVNRDIYLAEYYESPIHFSLLSTKRAVDLVKGAKKKKLRVTAGIAAHQLLFTEEDLSDFDSHFKVLPPLRGKDDLQALVDGLKSDVIDVICSDHSPQNIENKKLEFDYAEYGISGTETMFSMATMALSKKMSMAKIVEKFSANPRKILGLEPVEIKEGKKANLTFFDPNKRWTLAAENMLSKSKNNPLLGQELTGKALAVYNNGTMKVLNQ